jgi:hypothetical protein
LALLSTPMKQLSRQLFAERPRIVIPISMAETPLENSG